MRAIFAAKVRVTAGLPGLPGPPPDPSRVQDLADRPALISIPRVLAE
jgi:hypothetical protein